jgi:integrase
MAKYRGVQKKYNKFYYWIYHQGKTIWSRGYETALEASEERERQIQELKKKKDIHGLNITFEEFIIKYFQDHALPHLRKTTVVQTDSISRLYIIPELGGIRLRDLQKKHFISLNAKLYREKTSSVSYQTMRTIKKILNIAVEWDYLPYNPLPKKLIKIPERRDHHILSWKQIDHLINNLSGMDKVIIAVAAYTGLRRSEVFDLQWQDINFSNNTLSVERQYINGEIFPLKTKKSKGTIPMLSQLPEVLKEWKVQSKSFLWIFPGKRKDKPIVHEGWIGKNWKRIKAEHRLPPDFKFHDFRHSLATNLIEAGVPVPFVQLMLRHESYQTTADKYGHYSVKNVRVVFEKAIQKLTLEDFLEGKELNHDI